MNTGPEVTPDDTIVEFKPFQPDYGHHPGGFLRSVLELKNLSQADFAARTGLSTKHVNQVLKGSASMSADVAIHLERVLDTPAATWIGLEARWQEHRSRVRERAAFSECIDWVRKFPLQELAERDYLPDDTASVEAVERVLTLFRVANPDSFKKVWLAPLEGSFRRAQQFEVDAFATAAWLVTAERETEAFNLPPFSVTRLRRVLDELRTCTTLSSAEGFLRARRALVRCGVALTFVPAFVGSRVSGATWWPALNQPLIALSERHRKVDIFWFTLFHEIGHLLLHPRRNSCTKFEKNGDNMDGAETKADEFAAETLVPSERNDAILTASGSEMKTIATHLGVGISIVAGRKGHLTHNWPAVQALRDSLDMEGLRRASTQPVA